MGESALDALSEEERDAIVETSCPDPAETSPMLATLTEDYFSDPDWIFDRKLDGVRALVYKRGREAILMSRNHNALNPSYPELEEAVCALDSADFVADSELVTFDGDVTSFSRLQARMNLRDPEEARATGVPVWIYLFDLLWLDGWDVTNLGLKRRKSLLRTAIDFSDPIRFTAHRTEQGEAYRDRLRHPRFADCERTKIPKTSSRRSPHESA